MPFVSPPSRRTVLSCLLLGATLCVAPLTARAQDAAPTNPALSPEFSAPEQSLLSSAQSKSEIMANLEYLSDTIGPRLTGSARLKRANDWTAEKMKAYGLENVHLEPYTIPIGWERGPISFRLLDDQGGMTLSAAQRAWTEGTRGKVSGPVMIVRIQTEADFEQYKGKLKNAVILEGNPSSVQRVISATTGREGAPLSADAMAPGTYNSYGTLPAPTLRGGRPGGPGGPGAVGAPGPAGAPNARPGQPRGARPDPTAARTLRQKITQFYKDEGVAATLTDSGKPHGLLNMTGSWSTMGEFKNNKPERVPITSLFVANDHYALLYRLAEKARLGQGPTPRIELEAKAKWIKGPVTVYNTVGDLRGSDKPDEIVLLGGHLDSWDLAQGTTDNGTGTCVVLESARLLSEAARAGQRPKRTVRFVLFSGEEEGLNGSKAYVETHKAELPKHDAAFVHDTGTGKVTSFGLEGRTNLRDILIPTTAGFAPFGFTGLSDGGIGASTDHWPFHQAGVPGFAFLQDPAEYRLTHHSNSDTLDKARPADLVEGAEVMSLLAWRIANLPDMLPKDLPATASNAPRLPATGSYIDEDHHHEGEDE